MRTAARIGSALLPAGRHEGVEVRTVDAGAARFRIYLPEKRSGAALIWMHGGGMVVGTPLQTERLCAETAAGLGMVIFSVIYHLAPEHPFPAQLNDSRAVWDHAVEHAAEYDIDPARIAVGGESAGGCLAAGLAQQVLDDGGRTAAAQWLVYPMLDDRTAARRELDELDHWVWNNRANRFGWKAYLGTEPGGESVPEYAVPARRTDLAGLPPAWIGVGDIDLFYDEDVAYARRLQAAEVPTTLQVIGGAPHGFQGYGAGTVIAAGFLASARTWLAETV